MYSELFCGGSVFPGGGQPAPRLARPRLRGWKDSVGSNCSLHFAPAMTLLTVKRCERWWVATARALDYTKTLRGGKQ